MPCQALWLSNSLTIFHTQRSTCFEKDGSLTMAVGRRHSFSRGRGVCSKALKRQPKRGIEFSVSKLASSDMWSKLCCRLVLDSHRFAKTGSCVMSTSLLCVSGLVTPRVRALLMLTVHAPSRRACPRMENRRTFSCDKEAL